MSKERAQQPELKVADNGARWPNLQWLLAPAAGCDCQMLALTIADGLAVPRAAGKPVKR